MAEKVEDKPTGPSKSFMTIGPTLHYSHANVRRCWALAVAVFIATCFFWSKLHTGTALLIDLSTITTPGSWYLERFIMNPLSIYEYPSQIVVLGLLMGIIAVAPVLVSQLLSFRYSVPMIFAVFFLAGLPLFGIFLLISCIAVACRPLRFRSRFIAIALCTAPQVIYWAVFGSSTVSDTDPIKWGFSFAPWISAWLSSVAMGGIVIAIGHFTRYRPGLVWSISAVALLTAIGIFLGMIGFAELDYRLYIDGNNPKEVTEFHDRSITQAIDDAMNDPGTRSFLAGFFYPTEPILLREELKGEIQEQLRSGRWPNWFTVPEELNYQKKTAELESQYKKFIDKRPSSRRMPVALYYRVILKEQTPDIRMLGQSEKLHFYDDYPHHENLPLWFHIYNEFPHSAEAIEARWRIAKHYAGAEEFDKSTEFCEVAKVMLAAHRQKTQEQNQLDEATFLTVFRQPAQTAMTPLKLKELDLKLKELKLLISEQNRIDSPSSRKRLAKFVLLNPHSKDYPDQLNILLTQMKQNDPLRDNILLAKIILISDMQLKAEQLRSLADKFPNTDGGIHALFELAMLKVQFFKNPDIKQDDKDIYLGQARKILQNFVKTYPGSIFTDQAQTMLKNLPGTE